MDKIGWKMSENVGILMTMAEIGVKSLMVAGFG